MGLLSVISLPVRASDHDHNHTPSYFLFEENKGQFHENVLFRCQLPNGYMFLEQTGITYLFENQEDRAQLMDRLHKYTFMGPLPALRQRTHGVKLAFLNADSNSLVQGLLPVSYYHNYFYGNDASKWQSEVRLYTEVRYHNVYPGIDLHFYTNHKGQLKYDWVLDSGTKAQDVKIRFDGAEQVYVKNDSLVVETSCGSLIESPPIITINQTDASPISENQTPSCYFQLKDNVLHYSLESTEDISLPMVIDPALIFSTYSGSRGDNFGFTATYDSRGNLYAGGITNGNQGNYPVTVGAVQTDYGGGGGGNPNAGLPCDITISKYDSAGTKLLWATYLGGGRDEYPHSLVVNQDDDLYILGTSYSNNFPTTDDGYDTSFNGALGTADIIVSKISEDGKTLIGSTYIGGSDDDGLNSNGSLRYNYADDFRGDIIPDEQNDIYVASCTKSPDFPMVDAIDSVQEFQEGCLLQLNSDLTELKWATFLGGGAHDALYSVKVDVDSMVYVGGGTGSSDLKTTDGTISKSHNGQVDGYIAALDRKNHKLKKLSYWGTKQYDQVFFIDLNEDGNLFVTGQTEGNIKPSNSNVYGDQNKGQFIAKLDTAIENIEWQTSFGVRDNQIDISPSAFLVDNCEHIYVSGWGSEVSPFDENPGSTIGLETSPNAVQKTTDGNDFYLLVLDKDAEGLLYATYFGGDTSDDHVDGGTSRFDKKGVVYQSVCSSCPDGSDPGRQDFPVTPDAAFTQNWSPRCSNASFKIDLQIKTDVDAYFVPNPIIGCQPVSVDFDNRSDIAQKFMWDFGDGVRDSTTLNPTHVFSKPGTYEVTLTVIDSNTCNISDLFRRTITVVGQSDADFEFTLDPCSFEATFTSTKEALDYFWKIDDGTVYTKKKFDHVFEPNSTNSVTLYTNKGTLCEDSITKEIRTDVAQRNVFIPNVFTPNGDGLNDQYCVDGYLDGCDEFELSIYNRWGERVFHSKEMSRCWDGRVLNGSGIHPSGTYFYLLEITEGKFSLDDTSTNTSYKQSGIITLIRE
ncbi:MAG: gliding motility-associated C-terminal domain-containing protein [Bacteroidia bacterium]|nr:gliding motility-associated C-terminal domain-containing protein [Bacteroidia bacterium]